MTTTEANTIYPKNKQQWRKWLAGNHDTDQTIWVACSKKNAATPTISQSEAVIEALCFGWIDGKALSLDEDRFMQSFTKRKPKSAWSKINKARIRQLIKDGQMTQAGLDSIAIAKRNGSWSILDDVEKLIIPKDLESAFRKYPGAKDRFLSLSRSEKKRLLQWLVTAKREETRAKRIGVIVANE